MWANIFYTEVFEGKVKNEFKWLIRICDILLEMKGPFNPLKKLQNNCEIFSRTESTDKGISK